MYGSYAPHNIDLSPQPERSQAASKPTENRPIACRAPQPNMKNTRNPEKSFPKNEEYAAILRKRSKQGINSHTNIILYTAYNDS